MLIATRAFEDLSVKVANYHMLVTHLAIPYKQNLQRIQNIRSLCPNLQIVVISGCIEFSHEEICRFGASRSFYKPRELLDSMAWIKSKLENLKQPESQTNDHLLTQFKPSADVEPFHRSELLDIKAWWCN